MLYHTGAKKPGCSLYLFSRSPAAAWLSIRFSFVFVFSQLPASNMSLSELPATQKNDMVVSLAALLLEDAGEREMRERERSPA